METRNNYIHWIALFFSVLTAVGFIILNRRGIFAWYGYGFYTLIDYGIGAFLSAGLWIAARTKSKSTNSLNLIFWVTFLLPIAFVVMLPAKFSV
jgi:hypothetical protein